MTTKKLTTIIFGVLFGILLVGVVVLSALYSVFFMSSTDSSIDESYTISRYNTQINVFENSRAYISEQIEVRYNTTDRAYGLTRILPNVINTNYLDTNNSYRLRYEIDSVNHSYTMQNRDGGVVLNLFNENTNIATGTPYIFSINYWVYFPNDRVNNADNFYYEIIDSSWDTTVSNITVSLSFFESIREYVESPEYETAIFTTIDGEKTSFSPLLTSDTRLTYTYTGTLPAHTEYVVSIGLPEGFFVSASNDIFGIVALVLSILAVILVLIIFATTRSKNKVKITPSIVVPNGVSPLEVRYLLNQKIFGSDFYAILLCWLKSQNIALEKDEKGLFVTKIKPLEKLIKDYEVDLFDTIFAKSDRVNIETIKEIICEKFPSISLKVAENGENSLYEKKSLFGMWANLLIPFVALIISLMLAISYLNFISVNYIITFVLGVVVTGLGVALLRLKFVKFGIKKSKFIVLSILFGVLILGGLVAIGLLAVNFDSLLGIALFIALFGVLLGVFSIIIQNFYSTRGAIILGKMQGLKSYIESATAENLDEITKNEEMLLSVLPFAEILGVGGKLSQLRCELTISNLSRNYSLCEN